jgi:hypothetical protein
MSDSRRIGRCECCNRPVNDTDEWTRDEAGNIYCPWCAPRPEPTPSEAADDH